jgi:sugar phosphate isomerase/epimerase
MSRPIAIQLYSLREEIQQDYAGVLKQIADAGYAGVELLGQMPVPHPESARLLKELGLRATSVHCPLPLGDDQVRVLDIAAAYGLGRLVIPWRPVEDFETMDSIKKTCDVLNEAAAVATANGLELGYHNHWWECYSVDGRPAYQIMLEHLDPNIFFEVDTYWAQTAGVDPVAMLNDLGPRATLLHVKDGPTTIEDPMLAVGQGNMDYRAIINAAQHVDWLIVELDRCATDMMTAVIESFDYLTKAGLGHGR